LPGNEALLHPVVAIIFGGVACGRHEIPAHAAAFVALEGPPNALDPLGLMNPGKLLS
jgi:FAD/FMN-containing dehydrogenase